MGTLIAGKPVCGESKSDYRGRNLSNWVKTARAEINGRPERHTVAQFADTSVEREVRLTASLKKVRPSTLDHISLCV
jgi:hypothetical protein